MYPLQVKRLRFTAEMSDQNVVIPGSSTSQILLVAPAVFSLLALAALLWMNHQTPVMARPSVLLGQAGVVRPVEMVSRRSEAFVLRTPARAPPTLYLPSNLAARPTAMLANVIPAATFEMVRHIVDSAAVVFR